MIPALLPFTRTSAGWLLLSAVLAIGGAYYAGQHIGARDAHAAAEAQRTAENAADADAARSPASGEPDGGVRSAAAAEVGSARGPLRESRGVDEAAASMPAAPKRTHRVGA